jgi:hypothetical protein
MRRMSITTRGNGAQEGEKRERVPHDASVLGKSDRLAATVLRCATNDCYKRREQENRSERVILSKRLDANQRLGTAGLTSRIIVGREP